MIQIVIVAVLGFVFVSCNSPVNNPNIDFGHDTIAYAAGIQKNDTIRCQYFNRGSSTLLIYNAEASCGCAIIKDYRKNVKPGDSSAVSFVVKQGAATSRKELIRIGFLTNCNVPVRFLYLKPIYKN